MSRRIALIQKRCNLRGVVGTLYLLRRLRWRRLCSFDLRLRRLLLFLLDRFGDRVRSFGFLLDRLRLFLWLGFGHGLGRIGLFLDRLFDRFGLRRRRGVGNDRRLLGDLADSVFDRRLGLGDLLHQRFRIFLVAGLHAGHGLRELIGGNHVDGDGVLLGHDVGLGR